MGPSNQDSFSLRQTALTNNIPYYTTVAGSRAAVDAIAALDDLQVDVRSIQDYCQIHPNCLRLKSRLFGRAFEAATGLNMEKIPFTQVGLDQLKEELNSLKHSERQSAD